MDATQHATARDALIDRLHASLGADPRFVAAWLGGSVGRGDADDWSDVDLYVAVAEEACATLCDRPEGMSPALSPARRELAAGFGDLAVEGENSMNAGPDGVAMNVIYGEPPLVVDWYLLPEATARRAQ